MLKYKREMYIASKLPTRNQTVRKQFMNIPSVTDLQCKKSRSINIHRLKRLQIEFSPFALYPKFLHLDRRQSMANWNTLLPP